VQPTGLPPAVKKSPFLPGVKPRDFPNGINQPGKIQYISLDYQENSKAGSYGSYNWNISKNKKLLPLQQINFYGFYCLI